MADLEKIPTELEFHYLKTNNYRTFHVDGAFGGLTPKGDIYMTTFVERAVTPQKVLLKLNQDGTLGEELRREGKEGIIREIEAGLILDIKTAEVIRDWLANKIDEAKKLLPLRK